MDDNALSAMGRCGSYKMSAFGSNDLCSLSTQINRGLVCSDIATVTLRNRNKHSPVGQLAQKLDLWLSAVGGVRARNRPRRRFFTCDNAKFAVNALAGSFFSCVTPVQHASASSEICAARQAARSAAM